MHEKLNLLDLQKDFVLDEVVSIEDVGYQHTYDFTVEHPNCYVANDILVHNTGVAEEHGDVILLLHWDWSHNRDKDYRGREADMHRYLIIVAKNKQTGKTGFHEVYWYPEYFKLSETPLEGEHKEYTNDGKERNPFFS